VAAANAFTDRALAIDPLHVRSMVEGAFVNSYRHGATEATRGKALRDLETALRIDPLNAWAEALHSFSLASANRPEDAVAAARHAIDLDPAAFTGRWALVWALAASGRDAEALAAAEPALLMSRRGSRVLAEVAACHSRLGNRDAAQLVYQEIMDRARTSYVGWSEQAAIAASAGQIEEARRLLVRGIEARESYVSFESTPAWGPMGADEEGRRLLDSVGP
jgi:tetratricopeptide (TPR) repeat protein